MLYNKTIFTIKASDETLLQPARELLAALACECGYEAFIDTDDGVEGYVQLDFYDEVQVIEMVENFPMEGVAVEFSTEAVEDQNWNATWEQEEGFQPIYVDNSIIIYDVLHTDPAMIDDDGIMIGIEAQNAFGTGTHETTRMIVTSLNRMELEGKRILDCGCGTGILGIVALRCGAKECVGYDIDEWSVNNTRHNAELNGVGEKITVLEGDANVLSHVSGVFDVVVANINRNILLNDMPSFVDVMTSDGVLILSGFYAEDVPLLKEKAVSLGLKLSSHMNDGEWQCLHFTK